MPEKKAAKKTVKAPAKVAKKAAKKSAKKSAKIHISKDLRRAFEHLGRVTVLEESLPKTAAAEIATLAMLAQQEIAAGYAEDAADLLRAAEHLCFGALSEPAGKGGTISEALTAAIADEFEHRIEKAGEHWDDHKHHHPPVEALYSSAIGQAHAAYTDGKFRSALEFARAADALARVKLHGLDRLVSTDEPAKLPKGKPKSRKLP